MILKIQNYTDVAKLTCRYTSYKPASTDGRIRVWLNCIHLIGQDPLSGQGFGLFEKQYNLYVASRPSTGNDHVNMAYNDFLELGVEGGLAVVALWIAFLAALFLHHRRNGYSILPLSGFVVIQLTNFGFQALPVFALFLVYAGAPMRTAAATTAAPKDQASNPEAMHPARVKKTWLAARAGLVCLGILILFHQVALAMDFYRCHTIAQADPTTDRIDAYAELAPKLDGFLYYNQHFGDAWLAVKEYGPALTQYLHAAHNSSSPAILMKCAYCYGQMHRYDSSVYYYQLMQNLEPYKFGPRMALLSVFRQKGDKANMMVQAKEIVEMPVKVSSGQVIEIKNYARKILETP